MRTSLDHLPLPKQRELERVVEILFEEFNDVLALAQHQWKKKGRITKVILYGSYARGGCAPCTRATRPRSMRSGPARRVTSGMHGART